MTDKIFSLCVDFLEWLAKKLGTCASSTQWDETAHKDGNKIFSLVRDGKADSNNREDLNLIIKAKLRQIGQT